MVMNPNSTAHSDARAQAVVCTDPRARAGRCGRWAGHVVIHAATEMERIVIKQIKALVYILATSIIVSAIYGCATPYEPEGALGGYRDVPIGNDQFHITIQGNGYTNTGMMEQHFYRRAVDIAKQNDYAGYKVISFKSSMEPWAGICCFPVATGVIQGTR